MVSCVFGKKSCRILSMSKKAIYILIAVLVIIVGFFLTGNSSNKKIEESIKEETKMDTNTNNSTDSGKLVIEDIKLGTGEEVKSGDIVVMHYTGTLENGTKFDSSVDRNQPFETQIGVGSVIKGWDQGVPGMKVGGKRKLVIPPDLAYGPRATGPIPANSTLVFEVELLDVK